jgi:hypothetical protein
VGAAITGGTASSDGSVVALAFGDVLVCSGTVIAPHAVLTAAHCLGGSTLPDVADGDALVGAVHHQVIAAFVSPDFNAQSLDHDIAVVIVDDPLTAPPIAVATSLDAVTPGATMQVIGYGWTVANDAAPAIRRTGTSQIDGIDALRINSHGAPSQVCEGDSGGPALLGGHIIGVTSSGDTTCTQFARHTRADIHAGFVTDIVARTAAGSAKAGDRCWYQDNCAVGECLPAADDARLAFCTVACGTDGACPASLACVEGQCRQPLPSPGAEGSSCVADAACASGHCLAPSGSDARVCTQRCFDDIPGFECPSGEQCEMATDGYAACFAPAPPSDGGCHVAPDGGSALIATIVLFQVLRGRGRP